MIDRGVCKERVPASLLYQMVTDAWDIRMPLQSACHACLSPCSLRCQLRAESVLLVRRPSRAQERSSRKERKRIMISKCSQIILFLSFFFSFPSLSSQTESVSRVRSPTAVTSFRSWPMSASRCNRSPKPTLKTIKILAHSRQA